MFEQIPKTEKKIFSVQSRDSETRTSLGCLRNTKQARIRDKKRTGERGCRVVSAEVDLSLVGHWESLPQSEMRNHWRVSAKEFCFSAINETLRIRICNVECEKRKRMMGVKRYKE